MPGEDNSNQPILRISWYGPEVSCIRNEFELEIYEVDDGGHYLELDLDGVYYPGEESEAEDIDKTIKIYENSKEDRDKDDAIEIVEPEYDGLEELKELNREFEEPEQDISGSVEYNREHSTLEAESSELEGLNDLKVHVRKTPEAIEHLITDVDEWLELDDGESEYEISRMVQSC